MTKFQYMGHTEKKEELIPTNCAWFTNSCHDTISHVIIHRNKLIKILKRIIFWCTVLSTSKIYKAITCWFIFCYLILINILALLAIIHRISFSNYQVYIITIKKEKFYANFSQIFYFILFIYLFCFNILAKVFSLSSLPVPLPPSIYSSSSVFFRKGQESHEYQPLIVYQVAVRLSSSSFKAGRGNMSWGMSPKCKKQSQRQPSVLLLEVPQDN